MSVATRMIGMAALAASVNPNYRGPIEKQKTTSGQIMQLIRQGSTRFLGRSLNLYRGEQLVRTVTPGRNESCSCGSGKKFKKCCSR